MQKKVNLLFELCDARFNKKPIFKIISAERSYIAGAFIDDQLLMKGKGFTKKQAKQKAACLLLKHVEYCFSYEELYNSLVNVRSNESRENKRRRIEKELEVIDLTQW